MVAVLLTIASFSGLAAERLVTDEGLSASLQQALDTVFAQFDVRGCSTAILFSDDGLWLGTAGFSHEATAVSPDMLFSLSSVAKNYIAPLVLQLVVACPRACGTGRSLFSNKILAPRDLPG